MRMPLTRGFRRAGCGKSARPVRRGDSRSPIQRLLSYSTGPISLSHLNTHLAEVRAALHMAHRFARLIERENVIDYGMNFVTG